MESCTVPGWPHPALTLSPLSSDQMVTWLRFVTHKSSFKATRYGLSFADERGRENLVPALTPGPDLGTKGSEKLFLPWWWWCCCCSEPLQQQEMHEASWIWPTAGFCCLGHYPAAGLEICVLWWLEPEMFLLVCVLLLLQQEPFTSRVEFSGLKLSEVPAPP